MVERFFNFEFCVKRSFNFEFCVILIFALQKDTNRCVGERNAAFDILKILV